MDLPPPEVIAAYCRQHYPAKNIIKHVTDACPQVSCPTIDSVHNIGTQMFSTDVTLELIKLGLVIGLIGLGYIVGRTGLSKSISDIKTDISNIKNWIQPSVKAPTPIDLPVTISTTPASYPNPVAGNTTAVKVG
jgi:hypothetical protein